MDLVRDTEEKLREACCYGDIDAMADLIRCGVNVNSCNAMNGWTALHWACQRGHSSAVDLLLRYGADPTIVNHRNQTPGQLTALPHIRAKLGFSDPALTPSSPTNTPTPPASPPVSPPVNGGRNDTASTHKLHNGNKLNHNTHPGSTISPPPFPSNYRHTSPPPLLSSPPSSPSPPPQHNTSASSTLSGGGADGVLSSPSSSSSPPPLPPSPPIHTMRNGGPYTTAASMTATSCGIRQPNLNGGYSITPSSSSLLNNNSTGHNNVAAEVQCQGSLGNSFYDPSATSVSAPNTKVLLDRSSSGRVNNSSSVSSNAGIRGTPKSFASDKSLVLAHTEGTGRAPLCGNNLTSNTTGAGGSKYQSCDFINGNTSASPVPSQASSDTVPSDGSHCQLIMPRVKHPNNYSGRLDDTSMTRPDLHALDEARSSVPLTSSFSGQSSFAKIFSSANNSLMSHTEESLLPQENLKFATDSELPAVVPQAEVLDVVLQPSLPLVNSQRNQEGNAAAEGPHVAHNEEGFNLNNSVGEQSNACQVLENFEESNRAKIEHLFTSDEEEEEYQQEGEMIEEEDPDSFAEGDNFVPSSFASKATTETYSDAATANLISFPSIASLNNVLDSLVPTTSSNVSRCEVSMTANESLIDQCPSMILDETLLTKSLPAHKMADCDNENIIHQSTRPTSSDKSIRNGVLPHMSSHQPLKGKKHFNQEVSKAALEPHDEPLAREASCMTPGQEVTCTDVSEDSSSLQSKKCVPSVGADESCNLSIKSAASEETATVNSNKSRSVATDCVDLEALNSAVLALKTARDCCCCCCCRPHQHQHNDNTKETSKERNISLHQANKEGTVTGRADKETTTYGLPKNDLDETEVVLKLRVANSDDHDFIEVLLPCNSPTAAHRTYAALLHLCCTSLRVNPHQVERIRKLPNTRLRCDADVLRLKSDTELELVLRGAGAGLQRAKHNPAGFSQQPILY